MKKDTPTLALFTTPTQASILSAAITHYLLANSASHDPDIRAACEQLKTFLHHITGQVNAPAEPSPSTVEVLTTLTRMNDIARRSKNIPQDSAAYLEQGRIFSECYSQMVHIWRIPVHFAEGCWRLGGWDALSSKSTG